jgi:hypothetical protein
MRSNRAQYTSAEKGRCDHTFERRVKPSVDTLKKCGTMIACSIIFHGGHFEVELGTSAQQESCLATKYTIIQHSWAKGEIVHM